LIKILNGNSLEELKKFPDNYFHSVVTDPPYGLSFMGKKWDYDVPSVELWTEVFRVLKEGGYLLSFSGTRTQHRMAVNIEDAGFEIRDMIAWVYGSGFPKSHNIGKALDKRNGKTTEEFIALGEYIKEKRGNLPQNKISKLFPSKTGGLTGCVSNWELGRNVPTKEQWTILKRELNLNNNFDYLINRIEAEREVIGKQTNIANKGNENTGRYQWNTEGQERKESIDITIPSTEQAKQWEGWGTALKPALEPITMARKPFKTTVAENVLKNGVGGINIDGCRVEYDKKDLDGRLNHSNKYKDGYGDKERSMYGGNSLLESKTKKQIAAVNIKGRFPANFIHDGSNEVKDLFPNNIRMSSSIGIKRKAGFSFNVGESENQKGQTISATNKGSASRFFYCAKASKQDRNEGLEGFEYKRKADRKIADGKGGENPRNRTNTEKQNHHPTVKPTELMRYLVRLITPKNGIVLDCFMGSGSTGKACALEGFNFVGIELDKDYCEIAKARIDKAIEDKRIMESQMKLF